MMLFDDEQPVEVPTPLTGIQIADALVESADRLVQLALSRIAEAQRDLVHAEQHAAQMRERRQTLFGAVS